jgi:DNA-binding NarL/FixJ family response regulator
MAAKHSFDVVICDLGLPDIGGIDLMKTMRDRHQLEGIMVSGFGDREEDIEQAKAAGFRCCLPKPVDMSLLRKALADLG